MSISGPLRSFHLCRAGLAYTLDMDFRNPCHLYETQYNVMFHGLWLISNFFCFSSLAEISRKRNRFKLAEVCRFLSLRMLQATAISKILREWKWKAIAVILWRILGKNVFGFWTEKNTVNQLFILLCFEKIRHISCSFFMLVCTISKTRRHDKDGLTLYVMSVMFMLVCTTSLLI